MAVPSIIQATQTSMATEYLNGATLREIAFMFESSSTTVRRVLAEQGVLESSLNFHKTNAETDMLTHLRMRGINTVEKLRNSLK